MSCEEYSCVTAQLIIRDAANTNWTLNISTVSVQDKTYRISFKGVNMRSCIAAYVYIYILREFI